jgi:hypothetical protein
MKNFNSYWIYIMLIQLSIAHCYRSLIFYLKKIKHDGSVDLTCLHQHWCCDFFLTEGVVIFSHGSLSTDSNSEFSSLSPFPCMALSKCLKTWRISKKSASSHCLTSHSIECYVFPKCKHLSCSIKLTFL